MNLSNHTLFYHNTSISYLSRLIPSKMPKHGGDRKSHTWHRQQSSRKIRSFITDLMSPSTSKYKHMTHANAIAASNDIEQANSVIQAHTDKMRENKR